MADKNKLIRSVSDSDLKDLYLDVLKGVNPGNAIYDDDGYYGGGFDTNDYYTGQISDWSVGDGKTQREQERMSGLFSKYVFPQYEFDQRDGFDRVINEYERRRTAPPPAAAKAAPPPTPKIDTIQKTYQKQISDLTKRIETIQKTPPKANVPPPQPPTTPYSVQSTPVSLSNPYKTKTMGGIGQFSKKAAGGMLASIKSNLINF